MEALRHLAMLEPDEEPEDDFIRPEDFRRIENYKWDPQSEDEERRRYDR